MGRIFQKKDKKFSTKIVAASKEYLKTFDLETDNLTDEQDKIVCEYTQRRCIGKFYSIFLSVISIVYVLVFIGYLNLVKDMKRDIFSDFTTTTSKQAENDSTLFINTAFIMGACIGSVLYVASSCIGTTMFYGVETRKHKKIIEAFLPEIQKNKTTND